MTSQPVGNGYYDDNFLLPQSMTMGQEASELFRDVTYERALVCLQTNVTFDQNEAQNT